MWSGTGVARPVDVITVNGRFKRDGGPPRYSVDLGELPHDSAAGAVIHAVAEYTGTPPEDLDPLTESVDSDALEALVGGGAGTSAGPATVSFRYVGLVVSVSADGRLRLTPAEDQRANGFDGDRPGGGGGDR